MSEPGVLHHAVDALRATHSVLTDGVSTLPCSSLRDRLHHLDATLTALRIAPTQCIALECSNRVPAALALLGILWRGQSCLLLRDDIGAPRGPRPAPAFCQHHLVVSADATLTDPHADGGLLDHGLIVTANPAYDASLPRPPAQRLYLATSGTTGERKLVRHTTAALVENAARCVDAFSLTSADRVAVPVPIDHMYGLGAALLPSILCGASIDLQSGSNVLHYLSRERAFEPSVAFLVPSFCESLLSVRKRQRAYRVSVCAGDVLDADLHARYERAHGPLCNLYGSTELGAIATFIPSDAYERRIRGELRLLPGVRFATPDTDRPDASSAPEPVHLLFDHACGFEGYADDAGALTAAANPDRGGVFATQDLGVVTPEGGLTVLGRIDDHVNRDGRLVALKAIERVLRAVDVIDDVAVLTRGHTRRGAELVAFCTTVRESGSADELRRACIGHIARHLLPDDFVVVPALPRTAAGKIDRARLVGTTTRTPTGTGPPSETISPR